MLDLDVYPSGSFDLVVCFEAIEHVQEQRELIEGVARVMRAEVWSSFQRRTVTRTTR